LILWRAESGGDGQGEKIGVIAPLFVVRVCVSRIAATASTDRNMHARCLVSVLMEMMMVMMMTMAVGKSVIMLT